MLRAMLHRIDVALLPAEAASMACDAFIVVDVLRATTTIAALFDAGVRRLYVAGAIGTARDLGSGGRLLFGEVGGLAPEGFDFGNSPVQAAGAHVAGREAVLFTTNGTLAICAVAGRAAVYTGAITNAAAVAAHVAARQESVVVVCAGTDAGTRFTLEDVSGAGELVAALASAAPGVQIGDAARLVLEAWRTWPGGSGAMVRAATHARTLESLGLGADIDFALRSGVSQAVPLLAAHGAGWAALAPAEQR